MRSIVFLALLAGGTACATPSNSPAPMPKEFEQLKSLTGTWEGTSKMGDKEMPIKIVYELTSGGTAISEKLMPGTPHEMLSVYHKEGDSVGMTHYCSMGNQPHLELSKSDGNTLVFTMTKPQGISSEKETHMHQLTLTRVDKDTLRQEWLSYSDGKPDAPHVFTAKRVK